MDYTAKINLANEKIREQENQRNEAKRNGNREMEVMELLIQQQIIAKEDQLTILYNKSSSPPCKKSFVFFSNLLVLSFCI